MRKKMLVILLSLSFGHNMSYGYEPLLVEGKVWYTLVECDDDVVGNIGKFIDSTYIVSDTIIFDYKYYIFNSGEIMREDISSHKVYLRSSDKDWLFYDFSVSVGDTLYSRDMVDYIHHNIDSEFEIDYFVSSIDSLNFLRFIKFDPIIRYKNEDNLSAEEKELDKRIYRMYWVEGIGDIQEPFFRTSWYHGMSGRCNRKLINVEDSSGYIYYSVPYEISATADIKSPVSIEKKFLNNDGTLYIQHNGKRYNLLGMEVK